MILLDLSHTAHSTARTGIQRVCRSLLRELPACVDTRPICWDPHEGCWRGLAPWEQRVLAQRQPGRKRGAHWPLLRQVEGRLRRSLGASRALGTEERKNAQAILLPELFSPKVAAALPALRASTQAPVLALFHDAIALRLPELSPSGTVARYPAYLLELAQCDAIAAVSEDSKQSLLDYWDWLGLKQRPEVHCIPLGIDLPRRDCAHGGDEVKSPDAVDSSPEVRMPVVLCLCSIEGRKNHLALLEACEQLWAKGLSFRLELAGLAQRETGAAALARLESLRLAGRPLHYHGPVSETAMERLYQACDFTVYPSLMEGFGLPVLESLARGKPCLCSGLGALGESSAGGGCIQLSDTTTADLAAALEAMLSQPGLLGRLSKEASARHFRSWTDYARDLSAWALAQRRRDTRG